MNISRLHGSYLNRDMPGVAIAAFLYPPVVRNYSRPCRRQSVRDRNELPAESQHEVLG